MTSALVVVLVAAIGIACVLAQDVNRDPPPPVETGNSSSSEEDSDSLWSSLNKVVKVARSKRDKEIAKKAFFDGEVTIPVPCHHSRTAASNLNLRWTGNTVYYEIDASLSGSADMIKSVMSAINVNLNNCIKFVERTNQANWVRFINGNGCYSSIGMVGNRQDLSLGSGCMYRGTIMHEIGHALGFWHEHSASDRDNYVNIFLENVEPGRENQFFKLNPADNIFYDGYNTESIMSYGETAFSKNNLKTITAKNGAILRNPYEKDGFDNSDLFRIQRHYGCL